MNPFRSLFLSISRIPPVIMLFTILGLAVVVTMYVMNIIDRSNNAVLMEQAAHKAELDATEKVVYATKNIAEGEIISAEAVEEKPVQKTRAPVDSLNSVNAAVGYVAAYTIPAGTVVSTHAIKQLAARNDFEGRIKDGMRAITFGVDSNSGVAGFIMPGSHVDVVAIVGSAETTKAAPILSDVDVIAVGTTYQKTPGGSTVANPAGSVTVAVSPQDGIKLIRSVSSAKLYLSLRGSRDFAPVAVEDVKDLFDVKKSTTVIAEATGGRDLLPPPLPSLTPAATAGDAGHIDAPPPPARNFDIEMWSGSRKEVLSVPQG